jgi:hypothetical protein
MIGGTYGVQQRASASRGRFVRAVRLRDHGSIGPATVRPILFGTTRRKTGAISFREGSDKSIAVIAANGTVLLAVSHHCYCDPSLRLRSACDAQLFPNRSG